MRFELVKIDEKYLQNWALWQVETNYYWINIDSR